MGIELTGAADLGDVEDNQLDHTVLLTQIEANQRAGAQNEQLSQPVVDILVGPGVQSGLTVGTTAVELRVGATKLANRRMASLHNNSLATMYWGFTAAVTTVTGTPISSGQFLDWKLSDTATVFLIASTAGNNARITESA